MEITHAQHRWGSRILFVLLLLMPIWFPFLYTGAVLLRIRYVGGGELTGPLSMRGLYFLVFVVAAVGTWPLFKSTPTFSIGRILLAFLYYVFALVIGYMTAWIVSIQAFGP